MPALFLHRISVVGVYLYVAATTPDPAGRDPRLAGNQISSGSPSSSLHLHRGTCQSLGTCQRSRREWRPVKRWRKEPLSQTQRLVWHLVRVTPRSLNRDADTFVLRSLVRPGAAASGKNWSPAWRTVQQSLY